MPLGYPIDSDIFCIVIAKPRVPLCSFDLNCSDSMIAAGAELLEEEEDAYLFFWYEIA